ncbi:MAG: hypothetical protein DSY60_05305 [Persephonella sp.]|nr:MAG: hypothetical protein DSY60_05305 [Persephonella sp.]
MIRKFNSKIIIILLFLLIFVNINSCSQLYDNTQEVSLDDAGEFLDYQYGTVLDVSYVRIKDTGAGALVGGALGAVLASFIGEGKANTLAQMLGGLFGAYLGYKADTANAQQLILELDDGRRAAMVVRGTEFAPGDKVRVIYRGGRIVRVERVSRR